MPETCVAFAEALAKGALAEHLRSGARLDELKPTGVRTTFPTRPW